LPNQLLFTLNLKTMHLRHRILFLRYASLPKVRFDEAEVVTHVA